MNKTIIIVGVGALGSHVAQFLRNEAQLRVIDFDRVEAKNTMSQFHGKLALGKFKVQALSQTMSLLWGTKLTTNHNKLVDTNAEILLHGVDLIIDCLDNGSGRRRITQFVRTQQKSATGNYTPCLHGALAANGAFGRVIWDEHFIIDDEDGQGTPTCEDGEHLPFIAVTAAYLARAAQLFLRANKRVGFSISPGGVVQV